MANDSDTPADSTPPSDGPLMLEGPKTAAAETPIIDLEAVRSTTADDSASAETPAPEQTGWRLPRYLPYAAAIAFAAALGAIAGAAATSGLLRDTAPPPATAEASHALQASVAQIGSELATLKAGIASVQRSSSTQFSKLAERLDRSEKAQAEPAAKLAKIQESLDHLDRRPQQTAAAAAAASPDITGSVTPKEEAKPQVAEGWRLRDFYDGRAIVESRNGTLFRVAPGSTVPGLGKVQTIKRENGKVVVVTPAGIIAATLEPRRPSYYYRW